MLSVKMMRVKPLSARTVILSLASVLAAAVLPASAEKEMALANTQETQAATTINVANMDKQVPPCRDFYEYANGTWLKNTPIPGDYSNWGVLNIVNEKNQFLLKKIMENAAANTNAAAGSNEKKIGDFWAVGMDADKAEKLGLKPLEEEMKRIDAIQNTESLQSEIAHLQQIGIDAIFGLSSGQDFKDSTQVIGQAGQGGLGLPDRDYYFNTDKHSIELREQYITHLKKMFELIGCDSAVAKAKAEKVMAIETKLAEVSMKNTDLRIPEKTYHKMPIAKLGDLTPHFSWTRYLTEVNYPGTVDINIVEPDFFKGLDQLLVSVPLDDWKDYLRWHLVSGAAPYLSSKFVDEDFEFEGRILNGKKENLPRWKRVIEIADHEMGMMAGQLYVETAFPPEAKAKALALVHNLKNTLRQELSNLDWMGPETRKNAIAKLDLFSEKIGYPDKWRDYSKLEVNRDSYVGNIFKAEQFEFNRQLAKIGKPVDRTEWLMNPQAVNAYYMAEMNEIVFPAGILQPPIFDPKADDATNLGSMGMIIGHEMTHGFDDQGRKFDGSGNLKEWWTADDLKRFNERVDLISKQFDKYVVAGDTHFKGALVSGESAADLGGLTIAYKTLEHSLEGKPHTKDVNGFTPEQQFFLAFAQMWATNYRPEKERLMANTNPHPTAHFRVNGTLANMDTFEKAFECKDDCQMLLPSKDRCRLW